MIALIRPACVMLGFFTLLTGVIYPLAVTAIAQTMFPYQANGSMIVRSGSIVGSDLIGQSFSSDRYFWPRPSAAGAGYDAASSSGSNLGPTSRALMDRISAEIARRGGTTVAGDAATASASGLDPHISPENALQQVDRIAASRGLNRASVLQLVQANVESPEFGFIGQPRVNVLRLNLALDALGSGS